MELTKEALQLLIGTAQIAQSPEFVEGLDDPRIRRVAIGGTICDFAVPTEPRMSQVYSLADLIEATKEFATRGVVWHAAELVEAVLDDGDRLDRVRFKLTFSPAFSALSKLDAESKPMDQRSFVRMLRFELGLPAATVAPFRRLEWSQQKAAVGETSPGRDRLGRDIQAKVTGASDLPEELLVECPVYEDLGERASRMVRCDVETDPFNEVLCLRPVPGEIRTVVDNAQQSIHERLVAGLAEVDPAVPVFYGSA